MVFERLGMAEEGIEAVVILDRRIAAMARTDLVGNVPEEFCFFAHVMGLAFLAARNAGRR
jgi:hypothetical protein